VQVRDTVGAGDAFLATLLAGLLAGADTETLLKDANRSGADVAARFGALPIDQLPSSQTAVKEESA
jgi:fructokinase